MSSSSDITDQPSVLKWGLSVAASAGLTGMLCCVAPMVLFMFGIMGGTYAISFADFFYQADGSPGAGAWGLSTVMLPERCRPAATWPPLRLRTRELCSQPRDDGRRDEVGPHVADTAGRRAAIL